MHKDHKTVEESRTIHDILFDALDNTNFATRVWATKYLKSQGMFLDHKHRKLIEDMTPKK